MDPDFDSCDSYNSPARPSFTSSPSSPASPRGGCTSTISDSFALTRVHSGHQEGREDDTATATTFFTSLGDMTANSHASSAVVAASHAVSESDVSAPSVFATALQPQRRISDVAAIAPLTGALVYPSRGTSRLPSVSSAAPHHSHSSNSGRLISPKKKLSTSSVVDVKSAISQPIYPAYNVHRVLRRAVHPLFQHDIPIKIGRQISSHNVNSVSCFRRKLSNNNNSSTSASNFLPLSVPQERWNASVSMSASPWRPSQPSSGAAVASDGTPRRGFCFRSLSSGQDSSGNNNTSGAGGGRLDGGESVSTNHSNLLELLSTTQSTEEKQLFSPGLHGQEQPYAVNSPNMPKACPNLPLDLAGVAPVLLPSSLAFRTGSSSPLPGDYRCSLPPLLLNVTSTNSSFSSTSRLQQGTSSPPAESACNKNSNTQRSNSSAAQTPGLHFAVPSDAPGTPSTRVKLRPRMYNRRDIRRGRWVVQLVREECEARAALEETESYEAIRTLPASCHVWKSYLCPDLNDDYDALGYYILTRAANAEKAALPAKKPVLNHSEDDSAGLLSGDNSDAPVMNTVSSSEVGEDKEGLHRALADFENRQALAKEKTAAETAALHPAFLTAARRLVLLEEVCRDHITKTEDSAYAEEICRPYVYEHRVMTVGTLPLERYLRNWIGCFRARKLVHARQRERLCVAEFEARAGLIASSHSLAARHACQMASLMVEEQYYRVCLELLYVQDAAWAGVVLLRLREHVELFSLLFGGTMRKTRVCGRVQGTTLFRSLVLNEAATRAEFTREEDVEWRRLPAIMELRLTEVWTEPQARAQLLQAEAEQRLDLTRVIYALTVHYTRCDIELQEFDERYGWAEKWKGIRAATAFRSKGTSVEEL